MRNHRGFTLVELMVLIGIFGLILALSIPSFTRFVAGNRLATTTDHLTADLKMARTMAISSGRILRLTAANDRYTISDPVSGRQIADRAYEGGVQLAADVEVDFFPWGMADAATLDLSNCTGVRTITILPTGSVEVD